MAEMAGSVIFWAVLLAILFGFLVMGTISFGLVLVFKGFPRKNMMAGSALKELDRSYARGEISRDEYFRIRRDLGSGS